MNTYKKFQPNVFLAQCEKKHEKGSEIIVTTKYGQEHVCIVFNLIYESAGKFCYSVVRADGFNVQEWAKRKAERLNNAAANAESKAKKYRDAADEGKDFLVLAEPIKIGHHSEKRHRALIDRNHNRMNRAMESYKESEKYEQRAEYWERKASTINLSMPESVEFYEYKLNKAKELHEGLKAGAIERRHSYSLTYAKKDVNEFAKLLNTAKLLWE
jgi:hypothetical protein